MSASSWDRITPEGQKFFAEIDKLKELEVFVGYQSGDGSDENGVDIAQIAMWNEIGTSNMPSRPFLRKSVDENADKINAQCGKALKAVVTGGGAEQTLKQLGVFAVALVQAKIRDGSYAPNAPSTIAKKGSDKPLIDTGRMRQSTKYVIRKKGSG